MLHFFNRFAILPSTMRTILLITKVDNFRKAGKIAGLIASAHAASCRVQCFCPHETKTPFSRVLAFNRPDGIIIEGSCCHLPPNTGNIPVVYLDTNFIPRRPHHSVRLDSDEVVRLAFNELTAIRPASALFVSAFDNYLWSRQREKAFQLLCRQIGIDMKSITCPQGGIDDLWGRLPRAIRELPRPIAAFAANDESAESIYLAANRAKTKIPDDLQVVSVDDDPMRCQYLSPPLTSIIQNPYGAGQSAAELMVRLMDNPRLPEEHLVIPPIGLVRRMSSAAACRISLPLTDRIDSLLQQHALDAGFTSASVAAALGISRHLTELPFRARFGKSVHAAIIDRRFTEVERLLSSPRQSLNAIANLCGWRSSAHLKRAFKQRYGVTMTEWQRLHQLGS